MEYPPHVQAILEEIHVKLNASLAEHLRSDDQEAFIETAEAVTRKYLQSLSDTKRPIELTVAVFDDYRIRFHRRGAYVLMLSEGVEAKRIRCRSARHAKRIAKHLLYTLEVGYTAPAPRNAVREINIDVKVKPCSDGSFTISSV